MLEGKTALITGANGGIGRVIADTFANAGANLILHSRKASLEFDEFCLQLEEKYGVKVFKIYFDLTDPKSMKEEVRKLLLEKIPLDILINNAGVPNGGLFQMMSMKNIREVFEVNLFAQIRLTQLLLRKMVKQKSGVIINIASVLGLDALLGSGAYGISKAALIAFTRILAAEVGALGVRVNAVAPGLIDAGMASKMDTKSAERMRQDSAMHRFGTPEEVAKTVLFLCSDASAYINGQVLRIDGGQV